MAKQKATPKGKGGSNVPALVTTVVDPAPTAATLLFKSDFGPNVAIGSPRDFYSTGAWQDITGTDQVTGYTWPIPFWGAEFSGFQLLADAAVDSSTIGDYMENQIEQVVGPSGPTVYAVKQNLKINNAGSPTFGASQDPLLIQTTPTLTGAETGYITYWLKFQSDLLTQIGQPGDWRVVFEFKTGGIGGSWPGDYRFLVIVRTDNNNNLYWRCEGDNRANGGLPYESFWAVNNTTLPVPAGEWFKVEVFWRRSNGSDGRLWVSINSQVIADHAGPNLGIYSLPLNRIFVTNLYTGGTAPAYQWVTGLEIWNNMPGT